MFFVPLYPRLLCYLNLQVAIISVKQATIFISWSATNADLYWYPANKSIACGTD